MYIVNPTGTFWSPGTHHMWLDGKPTKVHATAKSVKTNYEILKRLLPIPMGIDHLKPEVLQQNKILKKMNLLNVGVINHIELENDQIKIKDAEITNPTIQQLYDDGELPYFSFVSNMFTTPCLTGEADAVEKYSIIGRVDFVEKGACEQCRTGINMAQASNSRYNAKAIIGDDKVAGDSQNTGDNQNQGSGDGELDAEPTIADVMEEIKKIGTGVEAQGKAIVAIMGKLGLSEATPQQQNPDQQQAAAGSSEEDETEDDKGASGAASDPNESRLTALEQQMKENSAKAAKAEAMTIVAKYQEEGKVLPKDLDNHVAMAMEAPDNYKAIMDNAKPVVDLERHSQGGKGRASDSSTTVTDNEGNEIDMEAANKEVNDIIKKEEGG